VPVSAARGGLTHHAVETVLGHRRDEPVEPAAGWDRGDFGAPWPTGPFPADAAAPGDALERRLAADR
jgi:hypothetical protein